jgi:hypothetical protein
MIKSPRSPLKPLQHLCLASKLVLIPIPVNAQCAPPRGTLIRLPRQRSANRTSRIPLANPSRILGVRSVRRQHGSKIELRSKGQRYIHVPGMELEAFVALTEVMSRQQL